MEIDRTKETEYFKTLDTYFLCNKNILQTAKKLNIHRSTLTYRLEKIGNFIGADLNDASLEPLFRLFFYFYNIDNSIL